jgi:hypothetical protein
MEGSLEGEALHVLCFESSDLDHPKKTYLHSRTRGWDSENEGMRSRLISREGWFHNPKDVVLCMVMGDADCVTCCPREQCFSAKHFK